MSVQSNVNQWMQALAQLSIGKNLMTESKKAREVIEKSIDKNAGPTGPTGPTHSYYDEQGNIKMPPGQEGEPVDPHFASSGPIGPMGVMPPEGAGFPDPHQKGPLYARKPTAAETVTQKAQRRRNIDNQRDIIIQKMKDLGYSNKAIKKFAYKTRGETNE